MKQELLSDAPWLEQYSRVAAVEAAYFAYSVE